MDNIGTEIGQKMRSAVKAKLIELGTGSTTGYIDDELPDYIMIMVANKRTKSQMVDDLNLFLGTHTETFVNWLHQVLQKLQEVTLPASKVNTTKKKANELTKDGNNKKDKDKVRKDKRKKKDKTPEPTPVINQDKNDEMPATPPPPSLSGVSSITEVFANQLIEQHAKKTLEEEESTTPAKKEEPKSDDEFNIPTISQIAENAAVQRHRKELTELEEIQQKIYIAKQQLKMYSEEEEEEESEDDDYLNIKANDEEFDDDHIDESTKSAAGDKRKKSPITFSEKERVQKQREKTTTPPMLRKKKSVLERLGKRPNAVVVASSVTGNQTKEKSGNIISLSAHRRVEKEIYVPISRRKEYEREREKQTERERERMRRRERERVRKVSSRRSRSRSRSRERNNHHRRDRETEKIDVRQRIGSRVIVIPNEEEKPEEKIDVPLNSVIKVKSRPKIKANRQPSKNLLLKAVAEAQKSIGQTSKPTNTIATYKPSKKNLVIQISGEHSDEECVAVPSINNNIEANDLSDEYIPEPVSQESDSEGVVYVPSKTTEEELIIEEEEETEEIPIENENENGTKFVVTLDGAFKPRNRLTKSSSPGGTPPPRVIQKPTKLSIKERIGYKKSEKSVSPPQTPTSELPVCENVEEQQEILKKRKERFSIRDINKAAKALSKSPSKNTEEKKKPEETVMSKSEKKEKKEKKSPDHKKDKKSPSEQKKEHRDKEKDKEKKKNLNELLQKKTKELIDESVSSSPIYMSKSDYEKTDHSSSLLFRKRHRVSPIQFDLTDEETRNSDDEYHNEEHHHHNHHKRQKKDSLSSDKEHENDDRDGKSPKKIKKLESSRKFDDIPALLSTVSVPSELPKLKAVIKERCKYFPNCRVGETCEYLHPATLCKAFPNCKFGDKCLYLHPKCKFDKTCTRLDCNFMHTISMASAPLAAPPLASSVIPVQNYKSISASPLPAICKFFPNCSNNLCIFYHPKPCRFGKHCMNKIECNFYHHDVPTNPKFKWVSPTA